MMKLSSIVFKKPPTGYEGGTPEDEPRKKNCCTRLIAKGIDLIEWMLFYNLILFVFLFGAMEFLISGRYGARAEAITSTAPGETFQIFFVWLGFCGALFGLPLLYCWLQKASITYYRFSILHFTVATSRKRTNGYFYPLYILRRIALLSVFWLIEHPVFQMFAIMFLNYLSLFFVASQRPLLWSIQNQVENYN